MMCLGMVQNTDYSDGRIKNQNPKIRAIRVLFGGSANNTWDAQDVTVSKNKAYVAANDGLHLVDISNPRTPTEISFQDIPGGISKIVVEKNIAYLAGGNLLHFVDVSNPATPNKVGLYNNGVGPPPFGNLIMEVVVTGNIAQIADLMRGLRLVDISNLATPFEIGFYEPSPRTFGVATAGNITYMSGGQSGLRIVDTSNPTNPTEVGSHPGLLGWSNDVAVVGNTVYLADGLFSFGGLSIIDASTPHRPKLLGSVDLGKTKHVTVQGKYAYLLVEGKLHIVNVSDPGNPIEVGFYDGDLPWAVDGLGVQQNYVYIAGQNKGLLILHLLRYKITGGISTSGGYLGSPNGDTYLNFPGGAFTDIVVLTYRHLWQDQDVGDLVGIGHTFELEAVYHVSGQPAQLAPDQSFDILVQYTDTEKGPAIEDTLALYYWDGSQWVREPSSMVDTNSKLVTAKPNHWATLWAVLGETRRTFLPTISRTRPRLQ